MPSTLPLPTAELARILANTRPHEQAVLIEAAIAAGLMWRCTCRSANSPDAATCTACNQARLWARDVTPGEYGELLETLRSALQEWFTNHPGVPRPAAVSFSTTSWDDGPAWDPASGVTFYFTDSPHGITSGQDFQRTAVADALVEISDYDAPASGSTLRVALPR